MAYQKIIYKNGKKFVENLSKAEIKEIEEENFQNKKNNLKNYIKNKNKQKNQSDLIYKNERYTMSPEDQHELIKYFTMLNDHIIDDGINWYTADNKLTELKSHDIKKILEQLHNREKANKNNVNELINKIEKAQTMDELNAIDINSGWTE